MTKYDCSAADLNPIGGINKNDLKRFLLWTAENYNYKSLVGVVNAAPTAELKPFTEGEEETKQTDEEDMGMTYAELYEFGKLRKEDKCGPVSMFERLIVKWRHLKPKEVADKVKRFFFYYSRNRHKMTILTPSYHAEAYGTDDNRYDLRQFLYNSDWTFQFKKMDRLVEEIETMQKE